MKKFVTFSLFVFLAVVAGVLIVGHNFSNNQSLTTSNTGGANQVGNITGVSADTTTLTLTSAELAKHNSATSCWLLISGKVYDVTKYLNSHPGGEAEILKTCGTDATTIYDNRDNTGSHSSRARAMLADYLIGDVGQTLQLGSGKTTTQTKTTTSTKTTTKTTAASTAQTTAAKTTAQTGTSLALTSTELAKHNSYTSCWLLISGKIYDVTTYLNSHPGGEAEILKTCGTDATVIYDNRDNTGSHSSSARAMLANFYIGDLNQNVTTSASNPTSPTIANPAAQTTSSRFRGGDDD